MVNVVWCSHLSSLLCGGHTAAVVKKKYSRFRWSCVLFICQLEEDSVFIVGPEPDEFEVFVKCCCAEERQLFAYLDLT